MNVFKLETDTESESESDVNININTNTVDTQLPWTELYRPKTLNDVISQQGTVSVLKAFIKNDCLPHLLFYGNPGVGKTSTILACARELYGDRYPFSVLEINASDERGIDVVRSKIVSFVTTNSIFLDKEHKTKFKLVILDETDAMTSDAQKVLRKVVEAYTDNARFCLICNYIKYIDPALISRCSKFRFTPLKFVDVKKRLEMIVEREDVDITEDGYAEAYRRSDGDMRRVINTVQSTNMIHGVVNSHTVNSCLGCPQSEDVDKMFNDLITGSFQDTYDSIMAIKTKFGLSLSDLVDEIHGCLKKAVLNDDKRVSAKSVGVILDKLSVVEYNMTDSTSEKLHTAALVSAFCL